MARIYTEIMQPATNYVGCCDKSYTAKLIGSERWTKETFCDGEDILYTLHIEDGGSITVLDRMTGYGYGLRDIESGYKDKDGKFWLASGNCDVRCNAGFTIAQAIDWIKGHANTCVAST